MFDINGTFLIIFVSFIVFVVVMKGLFFDPLMQVISEREGLIEGAARATKQAAEKQQAVTQSIEQTLQAAYAKAQSLVQQQTDAAREKAQGLRQTAKAESLKQIDDNAKAFSTQSDAIYQELKHNQPQLAEQIKAKLQASQLVNV